MLQWLILANFGRPQIASCATQLQIGLISKHPLFIEIGLNHNEANLRKVWNSQKKTVSFSGGGVSLAAAQVK